MLCSVSVLFHAKCFSVWICPLCFSLHQLMDFWVLLFGPSESCVYERLCTNFCVFPFSWVCVTRLRTEEQDVITVYLFEK